MTTVVTVPDLGDAQNVEVIELCVAVGDVVAEGAALIVLESDKASMEVPATVAGTVRSLALGEGDTVLAGQPICEIEGEASVIPGASTEPPVAEPAPTEPPPGASETPDEPASAPTTEVVTESRTVLVAVPDIGDAADVSVVEVCVAPGQVTEVDTALVVLESDKASMEVPAGHVGEVLSVEVSEGDTVAEGSPLVQLTVSADVSAEAPAVPAPAPASVQAPAAAAAPAQAAAPAPAAAPTAAGGSLAPTTSATVYAGPAVRRLARELGVDLAQVPATGARGRILKEDVQSFVKGRIGGASPTGPSGHGIEPVPLPDFARFGEVELEPLSRVQRVGATNLHRSWVNLPHVTHHDEVDVSDLEAFRASLRSEGEARGTRMTPLAFLVKACVAALKAHPRFNSSLDADAQNFILKRYYNIGIAVDTPHGLLVPVLRAADQKGLWELADEIVDLAARARDLKLRPDEMQGGTFSITSLGALGGTGFTPIINAPEVAILGVAKTVIKPVWDGAAFQPRKMMPLSLSYDHRAINGADGARFTATLIELLGDVRRLAL